MEPSSLCNFLALLSMALFCALAFQTGAPFSKCDDMLPGHGEARVAPKGAQPYLVEINVLTYKPSEDIKVHLRAALPGVTFKGFFIQGRDLSGIRAGTFKTNSSEIKVVNCDGQQPTAATHTYNDPKTNLTVEWIAPATARGRVELYVTFVKDLDNYYAKVESRGLYPEELEDDIMETKASSPMNAWSISGILVSLILFCKSALSF